MRLYDIVLGRVPFKSRINDEAVMRFFFGRGSTRRIKLRRLLVGGGDGLLTDFDFAGSERF